MWQDLIQQVSLGDTKALARAVSYIENEKEGFEQLLVAFPHRSETSVIGITGPPGAGKSTLTDCLIEKIVETGKRVAVLCVDPSSPFNFGAVLGDRIRMSNWYLNPNVFIRSLATRGALGGLHPRIIEITDLMKLAAFDYILIETVGVGQSEVEIAGLADVTLVVLVPEAGDEVQTMKAGLMEIADIFVVNKSDRPDAGTFVKNLQLMLAGSFQSKKHQVPIVKTIAMQQKGISELYQTIQELLTFFKASEKKYQLLAEKAFVLLQKERMKNISKEALLQDIKLQYHNKNFNIYQFIQTLNNEGSL